MDIMLLVWGLISCLEHSISIISHRLRIVMTRWDNFDSYTWILVRNNNFFSTNKLVFYFRNKTLVCLHNKCLQQTYLDISNGFCFPSCHSNWWNIYVAPGQTALFYYPVLLVQFTYLRNKIIQLLFSKMFWILTTLFNK